MDTLLSSSLLISIDESCVPLFTLICNFRSSVTALPPLPPGCPLGPASTRKRSSTALESTDADDSAACLASRSYVSPRDSAAVAASKYARWFSKIASETFQKLSEWTRSAANAASCVYTELRIKSETAAFLTSVDDGCHGCT